MNTPRNVATLLVATTDKSIPFNSAASTAAQKAALANVGDFAVIPAGTGNLVSGELAASGASIIVRTTSGLKFSEVIKSANLSEYATTSISEGQNQVYELTYPAGDNEVNKTFALEIELHDDQGSMLNERFLEAYVVTDENGNFNKADGSSTSGTLANVLLELAALMQQTIERNGEDFTVSASGAVVTVEQLKPQFIVGAKDGQALPFETRGRRIDGGALEGGTYQSTPALVASTQDFEPDGLRQLKSDEWFYSGFDKDTYRNVAWPASFEADSNIVAAGISTSDDVHYFQSFKDRDATILERQHRQLVVVGEGGDALYTILTTVVP